MPEASPSCDPRASPAAFSVLLRHAHDSFATRDDTREAGDRIASTLPTAFQWQVGFLVPIFATMYFFGFRVGRWMADE
jgi:hypothetical protein